MREVDNLWCDNGRCVDSNIDENIAKYGAWSAGGTCEPGPYIPSNCYDARLIDYVESAIKGGFRGITRATCLGWDPYDPTNMKKILFGLANFGPQLIQVGPGYKGEIRSLIDEFEERDSLGRTELVCEVGAPVVVLSLRGLRSGGRVPCVEGGASLTNVKGKPLTIITEDIITNIVVVRPYEGQFLGGVRRLIRYGPSDVWNTFKARRTELWGVRPGAVNVRRAVRIYGEDIYGQRRYLLGDWHLVSTGRENIYFNEELYGVRGGLRNTLVWKEELFHSVQYRLGREYSIPPYNEWFSSGIGTPPYGSIPLRYRILIECDARDFVRGTGAYARKISLGSR